MASQVTIITGAGGNIGTGLCRAFAKAGAAAIAVDLDPSRADAAARRIAADLTDPKACAQVVDEVTRDFGGIDTLVNAAQSIRFRRNLSDPDPIPTIETTDEDMRVSFETGPTATLRMMQLCYPHFKARGGGAIINFASGVGTEGTPGGAAYAAAKEAIRGLTKVAAVDWGKDNIRVNVVCPQAHSDPANAVWTAANLTLTPLRRIGDPEKDIGTLLLYLASPDCYMTGRTLHIDGGAGVWR
jgi:NAD(P)-dependent dehydrogenase (short-subunit alcohol dehydrogenase family)